MSNYSVRDLVDFTLSNEPTKAKEAFNDVLVSRLRDAIEDKKVDVAAKFFGNPLEDEQEEFDAEESENG